jgi:hypothetical protein
MRDFKRFVIIWMLASTGMVLSQLQPADAAFHHNDARLIGSWIRTLNSTDSYGNPCPYVPNTMEFFLDNTMIMSDFGSRHLPYKTSLTKVERHVTEERNPDLKGRNLLLVLPDPSYNWFYTPMAYAYSVEKNELTIMVHGWSPAKFARGAH